MRDEKQITLEVHLLRCFVCHCTEDLVNYSFSVSRTTKRRYFICRSHNRARNTRYYYKNKYGIAARKK